jgi:RNA polymerase sigma-B factor
MEDHPMTTVREAPSDAGELLSALAAAPAGTSRRAHLRDKAIEAWLPLARHLAHRYSGRGEPTDDLIQTATVGLIKAVDKFDPDRGVDFAGYAIPTIIGEIKRTLTHTLGRSPTVADISVHLGVTEEEVLEGLEGARAYNATSLSTPISADGTTELGDTLGGEDHEYELAETRVALGPALAMLDEREQKILTLRFYGNLTQSQIADQVGISQMHVSRLLTKALTKLRTHLATDTL